MNYKVEVGNLSERVKEEVEIITRTGFNPWVYDTDGDCYISESEKDQAIADWQNGIITLANSNAVVNLWLWGTRNPACVVAGHLEFYSIVDVTETPWDVYSSIPVTIPYGNTVLATVLYFNDGASGIEMTCMVEFLDPDGIPRGTASYTRSVSPGGHKTAGSEQITLDKAGTWRLHTTLNGLEKTWDAINVLAPAANLHGFVHDSKGNPLAAVAVFLNERITTTMPDGTFDYTNIPAGPWTIFCEKDGYQDFSKDITLSAGDNEVDITMLGEEEEEEGVGIWEWIKDHWKWIAGGVGAAAAIGGGIALAKKRK